MSKDRDRIKEYGCHQFNEVSLNFHTFTFDIMNCYTKLNNDAPKQSCWKMLSYY